MLWLPLLLMAAGAATKMVGAAKTRQEQRDAYEYSRKNQAKLAQKGQQLWEGTNAQYTAPQLGNDQAAGAQQVNNAMQAYEGQPITASTVASGPSAYAIRDAAATRSGGDRYAQLLGYDWMNQAAGLRAGALQRGLNDIQDQSRGVNNVMEARLAAAPNAGAGWNLAGDVLNMAGSAASMYSMLQSMGALGGAKAALTPAQQTAFQAGMGPVRASVAQGIVQNGMGAVQPYNMYQNMLPGLSNWSAMNGIKLH